MGGDNHKVPSEKGHCVDLFTKPYEHTAGGNHQSLGTSRTQGSRGQILREMGRGGTLTVVAGVVIMIIYRYGSRVNGGYSTSNQIKIKKLKIL